ncbi:uncharacterized protein METZ01_LOCUS442650 [marine metagenome]|uniref:Uncharacterized protein n=1 Tax=marine metagenome TaxID=408172 RepID=A0A382Z2S2_9ZZZZ
MASGAIKTTVIIPINIKFRLMRSWTKSFQFNCKSITI